MYVRANGVVQNEIGRRARFPISPLQNVNFESNVGHEREYAPRRWCMLESKMIHVNLGSQAMKILTQCGFVSSVSELGSIKVRPLENRCLVCDARAGTQAISQKRGVPVRERVARSPVGSQQKSRYIRPPSASDEPQR